MLLVLAPELRNELPRVLGISTLRDALSNLARAHLEGKHFLSGPADLLRQLGEAKAIFLSAAGGPRRLAFSAEVRASTGST